MESPPPSHSTHTLTHSLTHTHTHLIVDRLSVGDLVHKELVTLASLLHQHTGGARLLAGWGLHLTAEKCTVVIVIIIV